MARRALRKKEIKAIAAVEKQRIDEWRKTRTYKFLFSAYVGAFALFGGAVILYLLPMDLPWDDITTCTTTETSTYVDGEANPSTLVEKIECEPRALPTWVLVAAPVLAGVPLAGMVALRRGRITVRITLPGGESLLEVEESNGETELLERIANDSSTAADNFPT